jgi:transposase
MATSSRKNPDRVRERFSKEFKVEAVRLLKLGQKPATELALELGIRRNQLYKWEEQLDAKGGDVANAFKGPGRPSGDLISENERLRREVKRLTEERDILKKAAAYFAKELP